MTMREQIGDALFALVEKAVAAEKSSRRFVRWDQVALTDMPFLTILKREEGREHQNDGLPILRMSYLMFVYFSVALDQGSSVIPEIQTNGYLDAIDTAMKPFGADLINGNRNSLGGLVTHCYLTGQTLVDTGELDGIGLVAPKIEVLLPWY